MAEALFRCQGLSSVLVGNGRKMSTRHDKTEPALALIIGPSTFAFCIFLHLSAFLQVSTCACTVCAGHLIEGVCCGLLQLCFYFFCFRRCSQWISNGCRPMQTLHPCSFMFIPPFTPNSCPKASYIALHVVARICSRLMLVTTLNLIKCLRSHPTGTSLRRALRGNPVRLER